MKDSKWKQCGVLLLTVFNVSCNGKFEIAQKILSLGSPSRKSTVVGEMSLSRRNHQSIKLASGKVLTIGGCNDDSSAVNAVETFDPITLATQSLAALSVARCYFSAQLLNDGKILVVGGYNGSTLSTVELYDPSGSGSSTILNPLLTARRWPMLALLSSGEVLVMSGDNPDSNADILEVEVYNVSGGGSTTALAPLVYPHSGSTQPLVLQDDRVILAGGYDRSQPENNFVSNQVEVYDRNSIGSNGPGYVQVLAPLETPRRGHGIIGIDSSHFLAVGGVTSNGQTLDTIEKYEISNGGSSVALAPFPVDRYEHQVVPLNGTEIAILGGYSFVVGGNLANGVIYDYSNGGRVIEKFDLASPRNYFTAIRFPNSVYLFGGAFAGLQTTKTIERFSF